jgi:hypothetical protein
MNHGYHDILERISTVETRLLSAFYDFASSNQKRSRPIVAGRTAAQYGIYFVRQTGARLKGRPTRASAAGQGARPTKQTSLYRGMRRILQPSALVSGADTGFPSSTASIARRRPCFVDLVGFGESSI